MTTTAKNRDRNGAINVAAYTRVSDTCVVSYALTSDVIAVLKRLDYRAAEGPGYWTLHEPLLPGQAPDHTGQCLTSRLFPSWRGSGFVAQVEIPDGTEIEWLDFRSGVDHIAGAAWEMSRDLHGALIVAEHDGKA